MITLRRLQWLSVLFGICVSGYLSALKLFSAPSVCVQGGVFNCDAVLNSRYSELAGIPIAFLGFAVYVIIALLLLLERRVELVTQYGTLMIFGLGLFAWLFSMWLVYAQVALLGALCPWCLSHEVNFTLLFGICCWRLYREMLLE